MSTKKYEFDHGSSPKFNSDDIKSYDELLIEFENNFNSKIIKKEKDIGELDVCDKDELTTIINKYDEYRTKYETIPDSDNIIYDNSIFLEYINNLIVKFTKIVYCVGTDDHQLDFMSLNNIYSTIKEEIAKLNIYIANQVYKNKPLDNSLKYLSIANRVDIHTSPIGDNIVISNRSDNYKICMFMVSIGHGKLLETHIPFGYYANGKFMEVDIINNFRALYEIKFNTYYRRIIKSYFDTINLDDIPTNTKDKVVTIKSIMEFIASIPVHPLLKSKNKNDKKFECKLSFELELYNFRNEDGENDLDESVTLVITVENKYEYASGWSFGKYCSIDLDVPYKVYKYLYNLTLDDSEDNHTLTLHDSRNNYTENKLSITIDNF